MFPSCKPERGQRTQGKYFDSHRQFHCVIHGNKLPISDDSNTCPGLWCHHGYMYCCYALLLLAETSDGFLEVNKYICFSGHFPNSSPPRSNAIVRSLIFHAIDTGIVTRSVYITCNISARVLNSIQRPQSHYAHSRQFHPHRIEIPSDMGLYTVQRQFYGLPFHGGILYAQQE